MQNNTHSSRWRRAAHELQELSWWQGSICVGGLLGWAGWLAPSVLGLPVGPLSGEAPRALAAAIGLVVGVLLVPVAGFLWFYWRAPWRVLTNLQERLTALEDARAAQPSPRVRFEYDRKVQRVRLYVTNQGGEGDFSAPMVIDGPLSAQPVEPVFAAWEHTSDVSAHIARGETRALHLATLDTTSFPFAHWQVRVTADGRGASEVPAMHTSVVGGLPDTQAPRLLLHVTLVSVPDAVGELASRVIALDPFGAALLTR